MSAFASDEPTAVAVLPDRRRLALRLALVAGVLAALTFAIASLPGLGEVRDRLSDAAPGWLLAAGALQTASCLAFVAVFRGVFCRRLPWRLSYAIGMAAQGTNVLLPSGGTGGLALAAWALRRTGMPAERLARRTVAFYVLTSAVNFATAALAGSLLALGILAGAIGFMVLDVAALGAAFWAIGTLPPVGVLLLAYVIGQLGGLVPVPGGVGGTDGGLIAALVLYGTPLGAAAAAVLAYRAFQLGLPVLFGALAIVRLPAVLQRAPEVGGLCPTPAPAPSAPARVGAAVGTAAMHA